MESMFDLLKKQPIIVDNATAPDLQYKSGEIEFRNVTFRFGDE